MTKIQILTGNENPIAGYEQIKIESSGFFNSNLLDSYLSKYSDNECEVILANNFMNQCSNSDAAEGVMKLVKKLRLGGKLVIGGTDLTLFCKNVINDLVSEATASSVIGGSKGMYCLATVEKIVASTGLTLEYTKLNGPEYEISAIRK